MNGRDNLIPLNELTPEERREMARIGGIASGAARREKRRTLDMIEAWLDAPNETEGMTNENAYVLSVIRRGIRTGDPTLLELLAKLRGELVQKSEIDLNGAIPAVLTDMVDDDDFPEEKPKKARKKTCKSKKSG